jgi:hypothetical protein
MNDNSLNQLTWRQNVLRADDIWAQVESILKDNTETLPKTPRRPDLRLILNNASGAIQMFRNPAGHSSQAETIPASGDKTAAMVMLAGDTIEQQQQSAAALCEKYGLLEVGLTSAFTKALAAGEPLVKEAYGPAPFNGQADKLVDVRWGDLNIEPVKTEFCAYGVRAPESELAVRTEIVLLVQGTSTNPEYIENEGMVIAVSEDWKTKEISTRPIVPSVAKGFYGEHYGNIPVVKINAEGLVQSVDLQNGVVLHVPPPEQYQQFNIA